MISEADFWTYFIAALVVGWGIGVVSTMAFVSWVDARRENRR